MELEVQFQIFFMSILFGMYLLSFWQFFNRLFLNKIIKMKTVKVLKIRGLCVIGLLLLTFVQYGCAQSQSKQNNVAGGYVDFTYADIVNTENCIIEIQIANEKMYLIKQHLILVVMKLI